MVLLTPKFVLVAILASLTAFSLAPPVDAAAIAMRRSHQQHISGTSETSPSLSFNHADHPVLPLPARLTSASGKQTWDRSETLSSGNVKRQSPRDFFASRRRALTPEDLPPLLTRRDPLHHQSNELSPPLETPERPTQEGSGARPLVHIKGVNSHAIFDRRAPDPHSHSRHRHDSHHHHSNHHDHHHGSKHADDVVVIKGDNDNVHIGRRAPLPGRRHHHHHHHHNHHQHWRSIGGKDVSSAKEDNDLGRRSPDPKHNHHHHHHDHHGHGHHKGHSSDKVIIEGDDNNVSVHSRSRMARHQRVNYIPEPQEASVHHEVHARKYVPPHQVHHESESADREHSQSSHRADQDQFEKHPRSVLINSVEGEEKYLVADDYRDQRVTVIEGNEVSKVLPKAKRGDPGIEGVPGSIEIMSQSAKSEAGQRIASLVLIEPDSTMAEFGNNTFILNASESNHTQLYMVALNTTDSGVQGEDVPVALKVPVFNPESASMEGYCATYDPQPPAPAPLSAEPCFYDEPTGPHKSQVFAYTPSTSVIRPMWFSGETDEEGSPSDTASNSTAISDAAVDPKTPLNSNLTSVTSFGDFGNSTAPPLSVASPDNSTTLDQGLSGSGSGNDSMVPSTVDFSARAQNVTLIFTPATPVVPLGSKTSAEDLPDLDDETTMDSSNGTDTNTPAGPLGSSASGRSNDTETDWTGSLADDGLTSVSTLLPQSGPSMTVSPASVPTESSTSKDNKDLNVMVGVARHSDRSGGVVGQETNMKAVSTAPYNWKFDRDRS